MVEGTRGGYGRMSKERMLNLFDEYKRLGKHPLTLPRRRVIGRLLLPYHLQLLAPVIERAVNKYTTLGIWNKLEVCNE